MNYKCVTTACKASLSIASISTALLFLNHGLAFAQSVPLVHISPSTQVPREVLTGTAKLIGHADPRQKMHVVLGLTPPHPDEEEQFIEQLHTKGSPHFQKFLTAAEWNKRFAPSAEDEQAVLDWAQKQGLQVVHRFPNRLLVDIEAPVAKVEQAFGVTMNTYNTAGKTVFSNDRQPALDPSISHIVHSVSGLNNIQVLHPMNHNMVEPDFSTSVPGAPIKMAAQGSRDGAAGKLAKRSSGLQPNITGGAYDPSDIFSSEAYDVNALFNQGHCCNPLGNPGVTPPESSIAIATAGSHDGNDYVGFFSQYPYLAYHYQEYYIDGTPSCCDKEGTMDFEWSTAMSNSRGSYIDTSMVYMYDGVNANFSTFIDMYNFMLSDNHAKVMSTSWGCAELTCYPQSSMDTTHSIFNAMIGQGWTLIAASGDQGATAGCSNSLAVQYPSSDPNVVAAGGTTLQLYSNGVFDYQTAWGGGPDGCGYNDGGSTGGFSAYYAAPSYQSALGFSQRAVPDIALNADWYNTPQNIFFGGSLSQNGGTSIVAPELAGIFAGVNAYLDAVASINGGCYGGSTCAPIGNGNWYLYYFGENPYYAPHYPFYDVTTGCNNNDVTSYYGLGYYCAGPGYDNVTGWGSLNALQLAWGINTYRAGDFAAPVTYFFGTTPGVWHNTDQAVQWTVVDTTSNSNNPTGVAGFSQAWDGDPGDVFSEATPGSGNAFYSGPQFPNATTGYLYVSWAGQGCHTAHVRSWDNTGVSNDQTFGSVCYDTIAPITKATLSGTLSGGVYVTPVSFSLSATDASSGVAARYFKLDGGAVSLYSSPITVSSPGSHTLSFYSKDVAGNVEGSHSLSFTLKAKTTTALASSAGTITYGQHVTFTATVSPSFGGTPSGTVTFKNGSTTLGTAPLSSGKATYTASLLATGTHSITALYSGTGADSGSTSSVLTETVKKANTTTTLTSSLNPSKKKQSVTLTAKVTPAYGGAVSGTVTFYNGTSALGTVSLNTSTHIATLTTSTLTSGSHSMKAHYNDNANLNSSDSAVLTQVVH